MDYFTYLKKWINYQTKKASVRYESFLTLREKRKILRKELQNDNEKNKLSYKKLLDNEKKILRNKTNSELSLLKEKWLAFTSEFNKISRQKTDKDETYLSREPRNKEKDRAIQKREIKSDETKIDRYSSIKKNENHDYAKEQTVPSRTPIYLGILLPFLSLILNLNFVVKEKEVSEKSAVVIEKRKQIISKNLNQYFDSLKIVGSIPDSFDPEIELQKISGKYADTLFIRYSYSSNEKFESKVYGYCRGCYLWSESKSAMAWLNSLDKALDTFLLKNLSESSGIQVNLIGYTDGLPVTSDIIYKGEFGNFPRKLGPEILTAYMLDGDSKTLNLNENDKIGNPEIAFLRALSIREYLDKYVPILTGVDKNYSYFAVTQQNPNIKGGKYRKVKLEILVHNPKIMKEQSFLKKLKIAEVITLIATFICIPFLGKTDLYHYKAWQDSLRIGQESIRDKKYFIRILILIISLIIFIFYLAPTALTSKVF